MRTRFRLVKKKNGKCYKCFYFKNKRKHKPCPAEAIQFCMATDMCFKLRK